MMSSLHNIYDKPIQDGTYHRCVSLVLVYLSYLGVMAFFNTFDKIAYLYVLYTLLFLSFFCYPFQLYHEYFITMSLFFFFQLPLGIYFFTWSPKYSILYLLSPIIKNVFEIFKEETTLSWNHVVHTNLINAALILLTIPSFRILVHQLYFVQENAPKKM